MTSRNNINFFPQKSKKDAVPSIEGKGLTISNKGIKKVHRRTMLSTQYDANSKPFIMNANMKRVKSEFNT